MQETGDVQSVLQKYDPNCKQAQTEIQNWQSCFSWILR